jgi:hypothetical protein
VRWREGAPQQELERTLAFAWTHPVGPVLGRAATGAQREPGGLAAIAPRGSSLSDAIGHDVVGLMPAGERLRFSTRAWLATCSPPMLGLMGALGAAAMTRPDFVGVGSRVQSVSAPADRVIPGSRVVTDLERDDNRGAQVRMVRGEDQAPSALPLRPASTRAVGRHSSG